MWRSCASWLGWAGCRRFACLACVRLYPQLILASPTHPPTHTTNRRRCSSSLQRIWAWRACTSACLYTYTRVRRRLLLTILGGRFRSNVSCTFHCSYSLGYSFCVTLLNTEGRRWADPRMQAGRAWMPGASMHSRRLHSCLFMFRHACLTSLAWSSAHTAQCWDQPALLAASGALPLLLRTPLSTACCCSMASLAYALEAGISHGAAPALARPSRTYLLHVAESQSPTTCNRRQARRYAAASSGCSRRRPVIALAAGETAAAAEALAPAPPSPLLYSGVIFDMDGAY